MRVSECPSNIFVHSHLFHVMSLSILELSGTGYSE